jgi:O-antigen ligase
MLAMVWTSHGSIAAQDWLAYMVLAALLAAAVLFSGGARQPTRPLVISLGALTLLGAYAALSLSWSAAPTLARDEGLLTLFYVLAFGLPLLTLRSSGDRIAFIGVFGAVIALLAVVTCVRLVADAGPLDLYRFGRLNYPVTYSNAQAALFVMGFWPAAAFSASRRVPFAFRALSLGAATANLAAALLGQSKGSVIGLVASVVAVLVVSPYWLRLFVPTAISIGLVAFVAAPLTAAYRADTDAQLVAAIHRGAWFVLLIGLVGVAAGAVFVAIDRRVKPGREARRRASLIVRAALATLAAAGVITFFAGVSHPVGFLQNQWHTFKHRPTADVGTSHLLTIGSYRYDVWRVALTEFSHRPFGGIGARGFGPAYLQLRRGPETPARAHSLELEVLSEDGLLGFALLGLAVGIPLVLAGRAARKGRLAATAGFGAAVYWLVHASVDWIWTFPALGIPFFCLLGMAAGRDGGPRIARRNATPLAIGAVAVAAIAFAPWTAAKLTNRVYSGSTSPGADLRWAKRLDPVSVEPYLAQASLARTPAREIPPLEKAADKEPRSAGVQYLLGTAYLESGRRADAIRTLETAHRLDPREDLINRALARARGR